MTDILDCTDMDNILLNGEPMVIARGFNWVSPIKTDYYSIQCRTCTGWSHSTVGEECSTCMAVSVQKKWLEYHRGHYPVSALEEMVAAYRIYCETGDSGLCKEWCLRNLAEKLIDPDSETRV